MRLSQKEVKKIKKIVTTNFEMADVYLFGSRIKHNKQGGDIDLFIIADNSLDLYEKKIKTKAKLQRALNKPIDIVIHKDFNRTIEKEALKGVKL